MTPDTTYFFDHGFHHSLFDDLEFVRAYFTRMAELLDPQMSVPALHARVDAMADELQEAAPRNFDAWPAYPPRGGSFEAEIDRLKDWLEERHDWMAGCLTLPDPRTCRES